MIYIYVMIVAIAFIRLVSIGFNKVKTPWKRDEEAKRSSKKYFLRDDQI